MVRMMIFWWMLLLWAALIIGFIVFRLWMASKRKREPSPTDVAVAHTARLTDLPEYVAAFRKYRLLTRWTAGVLSLALLASIIITARPAIIANLNPVQKNRDIMLCLDASGSVLKTDTALIKRFSALVNNFQDQRFGMTLFNSSAVSIIPLNDNYQLIATQLKSAGDAFQAQKGDLFTNMTNGTLAGFNTGTSLTSDGLTSCIQHLGNNNQLRSQSIILATDNEVNGTPVVGMPQAIAMARERNIHVFVIDPGISDSKHSGDHEQLKIVASETEGGYFKLDDDSTVTSIIDAISKQTPEKFVGQSQPAINDNPKPFLYAAVMLSIVSMWLLWRLEL